MDFGAVHNFALPSVGPNAAQCLGACSWSCGDHQLPHAELIPWAIHTWEPGGDMLWPAAGKKGCLEGPESQAPGRHIPLLSCREPEGSSGDEAHSSQQLPWEGSLQPVPTAPQAAAANILPSSLLERQQDAELSTIALFTRQIYDFSIKSPVS